MRRLFVKFAGFIMKAVLLISLVVSSAWARPKSSEGAPAASGGAFGGNSLLTEATQRPYLRHPAPVESRRSEGLDFCRRPARCQALNYTTCLGTRLPYQQTTLDLVDDARTQEDVQEKLVLWQSLRSVPKCWAVIQPFLCALYMPRCEGDLVELPSQEMCKVIRNPCRIVELEHRGGWPDFMRCDTPEKFPSGCKNEVRELKFNTSAKCQSPLVETDNSLAYLDGVEGCGVPCTSPMFSSEEHEQVQRFTLTLASMCLTANLFAVATFLVDWRSASRYPAVIIFYMNVCFAAACTGWLAQYTPLARQDILCRKDGTPRISEPSADETLSCVVVFVLVYYSLMAASVWFVMLAYSWYVSFQALGKIREKVSSKAAYFHLVSWSVPLVLTITCMALAQIEAQSPHGICFVGISNPVVRSGFVLAPVVLLVVVGHVFLLKGLVILIRLKAHSADVISASASAKLRDTIVRLASFSAIVVGCVVLTVYCHVYEFDRQPEWKTSFRSYMVCLANQTTSRILHHGWAEDCDLESRPSTTLAQVHLFAVFGAGVAVSSWVWTKASVLAWRRWYRRTFHKRPLEERVRIRKHKIIAQAFAKRRDLSHMGRMSISIHSTHDDPVGFNIDLNSAASNDVSSAWAAAIPKFVTRRGAIVGTAGAFGLRRNSLDSEISLSGLRRVSVDTQQSRRHSFDSHQSQYSIQAVDLERLSRMHHHHHSRSSRSKRPLLRARKLALRRRGSSTSQTSSKGSQILPAITKRRELLQLSRSTIADDVASVKQRLAAGAAGGAPGGGAGGGNGGVTGASSVDVERIERFSLNLPGDADSGSDSGSDLEATTMKVADVKVTQSTQTACVWDAGTQTSPSLRQQKPWPASSSAAGVKVTSTATQMTPPSTSCDTSPETVRKARTPAVAVVKRGRADGSPNDSSGGSEDDDPEHEDSLVASPSQSLLNYLLPVSSGAGRQDQDQDRRRSSSRSAAGVRAGAFQMAELDRASIARLLEKLRDEDRIAGDDSQQKRSLDRHNKRSDAGRRKHSERVVDDVEMDYLISSKNSNRSDRSRKSQDNRRSRSKQDSSED